MFAFTFMAAKSQTVVDIVVNSDVHNTLEAAVGAAGLVETLNGDGPFTLFAPTDAAFESLPDGTVEALLEDPDGALREILLYHAVSGNVASSDLSDGMMPTTINGKDINVTINQNGVFINDAQVTMADIPADNGVVHVIDAVLLPPTITVVDIIVNSDVHNTLEAAVGAAGLVETLNGEGPFTVFAPTDAAFEALPAGTVEALLQDPQGALTDILLYHVLGAEAYSGDLMDGMTVATANGKDIVVTVDQNGVFINDAQVILADIPADNGVVHVIDAVLLPPRITVVDIIVNSDVHNTLEAAVGAAGLVDALNGEGPFTVFAPTDAAFEALPAGTVEALLQDPQGLLTNILLNHVVGANVLSTDLADGMFPITLNNGKYVNVTINQNGVFINDAQVIMADIPTDNGVVHVIDAVLLPPSTVADIVIQSDIHNTLEAAVGAAGLVPALNGPGLFTVFAPTDDAFAALPAGTVEALLQDPQGLLTDILTYHVVGSAALSTDLSNGQTIVTLNNGKTITVNINMNGVFINNAQVMVADVPADNGVVHVIDAVLLPPNTVVDVIVESPVHNTLEAAVAAAGLIEPLNGAGPFTVFAPTDDAFAALPDGTVETLLQDPEGLLTEILAYHVVGGLALSSDLMDGMTVPTVNGKDVTVTINNNGVFINDAQVIIADVPADNGVVHVIDAVLLPPRVSVVDIIVNSDVHNTLEAAVGAAGLVETLNGDGPFTVFAPTDAAFEALPEGTVEALLQDPQGALTDILLYHVAGAEAYSTDLMDGMTIETVNGKDVTITINNNGVFINDAQVILADIPADNGVVHVINAVLLPPRVSVVDIIVNSDVHNTLEAAVGAAGLVETLNGDGPFTVFAPTDAAFEALPEGTVEALLQDPQGALTDILLYHVVNANAFSTDLTDGQSVETINGQEVSVTINTDGVFINDAQVILADIPADNGVVHVIDAVLLPSTSTADYFSSPDAVQVYPNPADNILTISYPELENQIGSVELIDVNGRLVKRSAIDLNRNNMNVSEVEPGSYLLKISVENNFVYKRVVIQ